MGDLSLIRNDVVTSGTCEYGDDPVTVEDPPFELTETQIASLPEMAS